MPPHRRSGRRADATLAGRAPRPAADYSSCWVGRMTSSLMLTCDGCMFAKTIALAMSAGSCEFSLRDAGEAHELGRLMREVGFAFMQVMRTGSASQMGKARDVLAGTRRDLYRILADGDTAGEAPESDATPDTGADADTVN